MSYRVPFVNYPEQYHNMQSEIDWAIHECLSNGDFILRGQLKRFEDHVASFLGVKYAVGLASGTDALRLSVLAAGLGQGDEIITVAHTFVATVAVIVQVGATPVLVDVGEDFNMDVGLVEEVITPKTKAIIPVHLNGRLCDMEKLMAIAYKHNLIVIEDAAQALGATFDGKKAGSFGLTGCFSFYPAKILGGIGEGGMVVTNSREVAEKIRLLRDHGQDRTTGEIVFYGYNSRLDNLKAAVLDVKFAHLSGWIIRRRALAYGYGRGLSDIPQVKIPPCPQAGRYFDIFTNYVIRVERRDDLVTYLREQGVEVMVQWAKAMHHHKGLGLGHFSLPMTDMVSREVVSLPLYNGLSNEQVDYVIEYIRSFYGG